MAKAPAKTQKVTLGGVLQLLAGNGAALPVWLLRSGLAAVLVSVLSLPLAIAKRKIAQLQHELNVADAAQKVAETDAKIKALEAERSAAEAKILALKQQGQAQIQAIKVEEINLTSVLKAIEGAASWEDILLK